MWWWGHHLGFPQNQLSVDYITYGGWVRHTHTPQTCSGAVSNVAAATKPTNSNFSILRISEVPSVSLIASRCASRRFVGCAVESGAVSGIWNCSGDDDG